MENTTRWWFGIEDDEIEEENEEYTVSPTAELESVREWEHEYLNLNKQREETKKEERL